MTVNNIRVFLEVYSSMSITEASRKLHMTQPVISRMIRNLEEEYESRFFERMGKRLAPTDAGTLFYIKMSRIIHDMDSVKAELRSESDRQTVRIGAAIMLGNFLMPELCARVKERFPNITVRVTVAPGPELKTRLLSNELDFALIEDLLHEDSLKNIPFDLDEMVPVFSKDSPLSLRDTLSLKELSAYPFLLREQGSGTRNYVDSLFSSKELVIDALWESSSTTAIIRGVENNIGVSVLPRRFVNEYIKRGELATAAFSDEIPSRPCFIVYHKDKYLPELYRDMFNIIKHLSESS